MFDASIILALQTYFIPIVVAGSVLFGETVIFPAALLSAQGFGTPVTVYAVAFIGTIASDSCWYWISRKKFVKFKRFATGKEKVKAVAKKIHRGLTDAPEHVLLISKFLYGLRTVTILYVASEGVSFGRFLLYEILGVIPWLTLVVGGGYLAGRELLDAEALLSDIKVFITILVVIIVVYKLLTLWIGECLSKK